MLAYLCCLWLSVFLTHLTSSESHCPMIPETASSLCRYPGCPNTDARSLWSETGLNAVPARVVALGEKGLGDKGPLGVMMLMRRGWVFNRCCTVCGLSSLRRFSCSMFFWMKLGLML